MKLAIIADDFTGAMDTGVQLAEMGISTIVVTEENLQNCIQDGSVTVISIDTESRFDPPETAAAKVKKAVETVKGLGVEYIYKKVDSAMRGNIGKELEAVYESTRISFLPFIPAYPANNRTTVKGKQYVDGVPVNQSKLGKDPFSPVRSADIGQIIHEQSDTAVCTSSGREENLTGICIYDASSDEEMEWIARQLQQKEGVKVIAGCAGFARYLPFVFGIRTDVKPRKIREGNVLVVCGSVCEVSLEQMRLLKEKGYPFFTISESCPDHFIIEKAVAGLKSSGVFILESISDRNQMLDNQELEEERERIKLRLAELTKSILDCASVVTLFIIGGETLHRIMDEMDAEGIIPESEMIPGIPIGIIQGDSLQVASKSGGFGETRAVDQALSQLMGVRWIEKVI